MGDIKNRNFSVWGEERLALNGSGVRSGSARSSHKKVENFNYNIAKGTYVRMKGACQDVLSFLDVELRLIRVHVIGRADHEFKMGTEKGDNYGNSGGIDIVRPFADAHSSLLD